MTKFVKALKHHTLPLSFPLSLPHGSGMVLAMGHGGTALAARCPLILVGTEPGLSPTLAKY